MASDLVTTARELVDVLGATTPDSDRVDELIGALAESLRSASPADRGQALAALAVGVNTLRTESAGVVARVVGAMVEAGVEPAPARPAIVGALQTTLPACVSLADEAREAIGALPEYLADDDEAAEAWLAEEQQRALNEVARRRRSAAVAWQRLGEVWPGAIALLSVDPQARAEARDLAAVAEQLEDVHEAAGWLHAMLLVLDDEPFVAIEPATRTGIVGRMSGIVDNFQLTTLLMEEFPGDSPRVSKAAAAVARGEGEQRIDETVTGIWDLFTFEALQAGGGLPDATDRAFSATWIWQEGMPCGIPSLDGHRVILLAPTSNPRTWPAQRMFLRLRAGLTAQPLDEAAVDGWLARIEAAVSSDR